MQIQFSEREKQVIESLVQGKSDKQIALALEVSDFPNKAYCGSARFLAFLNAAAACCSKTLVHARTPATSTNRSALNELKDTMVKIK